MAQNANRVPHAEAMRLARTLYQALDGTYEKFLFVGSLRRRKATVGDIEAVVIPISERQTDMFGNQIDGIGAPVKMDAVLSGLEGVTELHATEKMRKFHYHGTPVEITLATEDTWGCLATIRTGCAELSHWIVTDRRKGGGKPSHLRFVDGLLWSGQTIVPTPEERDVFDALGLTWVEPTERTTEYAKQLWRH